MNEKSFATDPRGFLRITKTPPVTGDQSPAAKRRKNAAHGASRGLNRENEKAPEGRKNFTLTAVGGDFPIILRFAFHSGTGETMSHRPALLYVPANTGSTLRLHPANFSRRNERAIPCI
jgi:hypothetical protein